MAAATRVIASPSTAYMRARCHDPTPRLLSSATSRSRLVTRYDTIIRM